VASPLPLPFPLPLPLLWSCVGQDTESFLFGLRNSSTSKLAFNDWRLKFYLQSDFPDIFRPVLQVPPATRSTHTHHPCVHCCGACAYGHGGRQRCIPFLTHVLPPSPCSPPQGPDDFYRIGEIVESSQQKTMVCKARVFEVRRNHTYDIRYATAHGTDSDSDSAAGLQAGCWVSTSHLTAHRSPPSLLCNPSTATSMTMLLMCVLL